MKHYLFEIKDSQGYLIACPAYECATEQEAREKATYDAAGDTVELVDSWEAEQSMQNLDMSIADKDCPDVGQDCPFCPKGDNGHHQYKIKAGCYANEQPSCEWCAMTEQIVQLQSIVGACICGVDGCKGLGGVILGELSEAERASLFEATPFDSGICKDCGNFINAGMLHEHRCS